VTEAGYIEVSRKAHELSHSHGRNAHKCAAKLAAAALTEGKMEEHDSSKHVEAALGPRVAKKSS